MALYMGVPVYEGRILGERDMGNRRIEGDTCHDFGWVAPPG